VDVRKAEFITPKGDPLVRKQMYDGWDYLRPDGINQYNHHTVNGQHILTMNLKAEVGPSDYASKVAQSGFFTVEDVGNIPAVWDSANPGGKPTLVNGYLTAKVTFTGMPDSNAAFGLKTAKLMHGGKEIASNPYAVYFDALSSTHPPCTTCPNCPNWFWYWREGKVCGIPADSKYVVPSPYDDLKNAYAFVNKGSQTVFLTPKAFFQYPINKTGYSTTKELSCLYDPVTYPPITVGGYGGFGIYAVERIMRHETEHLEIRKLTGTDTDGDGIPDAREADYRGLKTDPAKGRGDTYNLKSHFSDRDRDYYDQFGDQELRCYRAETHNTSIKADLKKDWSIPGMQHLKKVSP